MCLLNIQNYFQLEFCYSLMIWHVAGDLHFVDDDHGGNNDPRQVFEIRPVHRTMTALSCFGPTGLKICQTNCLIMNFVKISKTSR